MVRMPRWLLVVTVALSLAALLLIANLPDSGSDSDNFKFKSNLEMPSVEHYVWMGCQSGLPAGKALFFAQVRGVLVRGMPLRLQQCVQLVALWHPPGQHLVQTLGP